MARFYANENFPQPVVEALRALGHEVAETEGFAGRDDADERFTRTAVDRVVRTEHKGVRVQLECGIDRGEPQSRIRGGERADQRSGLLTILVVHVSGLAGEGRCRSSAMRKTKTNV